MLTGTIPLVKTVSVQDNVGAAIWDYWRFHTRVEAGSRMFPYERPDLSFAYSPPSVYRLRVRLSGAAASVRNAD